MYIEGRQKNLRRAAYILLERFFSIQICSKPSAITEGSFVLVAVLWQLHGTTGPEWPRHERVVGYLLCRAIPVANRL
jgi:hypothetical protein